MSTTTADFRKRIDSYLLSQIDEQVQAAGHIHPNYEALWMHLSQIVRAGGKRLRPQLLLHTYHALGGTDIEKVLPIAAAVELFHISILIHDDVIDRDETRHGVDNMVGIYKKAYRPQLTDETSAQHFAESAAILAGDALLSKAYALLGQADIEDTARKAVIQTFYDAVFSVAGGELLDTENSFAPVGSIESKVIIQHKTSSYSFIGPMTMGLHLAKADNATKELLRDLGNHLGSAFQLQDDYQSVFEPQHITGKPAYGDLREGKRTHLIELFYESADKKQMIEFELGFGKSDLSDTEAQVLQSLLKSSGALKALRDTIGYHGEQARTVLSRLAFKGDDQAFFEQLINLSTGVPSK